MKQTMRVIQGLWLAGLLAGTPASVFAQPAGQAGAPLEPEVLARCAVEVRRLQAHHQQALAAELQHQLDLYLTDPAVHQAVRTETAERITQARKAFNRYYAKLVAEGDQASADRMRQLFEISLTGVPANKASQIERAGPTPTPQ